MGVKELAVSDESLTELSRRSELFGLSERFPDLKRKQGESSNRHGQRVLELSQSWPTAFHDVAKDFEKPKPPKLKQADVVVFLNYGNPRWSLDPAFKTIGVTCQTIDAKSLTSEQAREIVRECKPKLIINRSFRLAANEIEELAADFPRIKWLTINHSSQAFTGIARRDIIAQNEFAKLAIKQENCWLGTPDERNPLRELGRRFIWIPNIVLVPELVRPRLPAKPLVVSLAGRRDVVKNFPTQIVAAGIANRTVPLRLVIFSNADCSDLIEFARLNGVQAEFEPWKEQEQFLRRIGELIDIGLQASLTESFNYVAVEHMARGIPVVGSPAIRYLPAGWQADPDDSRSIAVNLVQHALRLPERRTEARLLAEQLALKNLQAFGQVMRSLLV